MKPVRLALVALAAAGTWATVRLLFPWASNDTATGWSVVVAAIGLVVAVERSRSKAPTDNASGITDSSTVAGFGSAVGFEASFHDSSDGYGGGGGHSGGGDGGGGGGDGGDD
jgi:hypothetical protein